MVQLELRWTLSTAEADTLRSIHNVAVPPFRVDDPKERAILFLRAASGRASIGLAAFYLYLAANHYNRDATKPPHTEEVKRATIRLSALWTTALCVRSIFDHEAGSALRLNAKSVLDSSAAVREQVAEYWAQGNPARLADAQLALRFIARFLERSAVSTNDARKSDCILTRRIALMKAFSDRQAAHISMHHFEFTGRDIAHAVAAMALVGAIIYHFDQPLAHGADYLVSIDVAAHASAVEIFPEFRDGPRLFSDSFIHSTLHNLYAGQLMDGVEYLSRFLLSALGWDDAATV